MFLSIAVRVKESGDFLLWDEGPMLRQIAEDYGITWPENL